MKNKRKSIVKYATSARALAVLATAWLGLGVASAEAEIIANYAFDLNSRSSSDTSTNWGTSNLINGAGLPDSFDTLGTPAPSIRTTYASLGNNLAAALSGDDYYSFTITPDSGADITYINMTFDLYKTANAGSLVSVNLLTSLDSFAASVGVATLVGTGDSGGFKARAISLASLDANLTDAVEFRLYLDDGGGSNNNNEVLLDNLVVNGTPIPEPTSLALLGLGGLLIARRRRTA